VRARLRDIWPQCRGERILALGYGVPFLKPMLEEAGVLGNIESRFGVPREVLVAMADPVRLADCSPTIEVSAR